MHGGWMYNIVTQSDFVAVGIPSRTIKQANGCCLLKLNRGVYSVILKCPSHAHRRLADLAEDRDWTAVHETHTRDELTENHQYQNLLQKLRIISYDHYRDGDVISGVSAAWLYDIPLFGVPRATPITVSHPTSNSRSSSIIRTKRELDERDIERWQFVGSSDAASSDAEQREQGSHGGSIWPTHQDRTELISRTPSPDGSASTTPLKLATVPGARADPNITAVPDHRVDPNRVAIPRLTAIRRDAADRDGEPGATDGSHQLPSLRVISPIRTSFELTHSLGQRAGFAALESTLRRSMLGPHEPSWLRFGYPDEFHSATRARIVEDFLPVIARLTRGRRSAKRMIEHVSPLSESIAESFCSFNFHALKISGFTQQVKIFDDRGFISRVDFLHEESKTIIEVDGLEKYVQAGRDQISRQSYQHNRLLALGYTIVRFRFAELLNLTEFQTKLYAQAPRLKR